MRRVLAAVVAAASGLALLSGGSTATAGPDPVTAAPGAAVDSPNLVLVVVDDATAEDLRYMPRLQRRFVDRGTAFRRSYVPMPQCCPARATLLTGQYPHNHGVLDVKPPLGGWEKFKPHESNTIATYLTGQYRTLLLGKYLNSFTPDDPAYQAPGWDDWMVPTEDTTYDYVDQEMYVNGERRTIEGYVPDAYGRMARRFVRDAAGGDEPFFAYLSWVAPHAGSPRSGTPGSPYVSPEYRGSYDGPRRVRDASYDERDVSDKPADVSGRKRLTPREERRVARALVKRRESLQAVDRQLAGLDRTLKELGIADETYVMITSDNGYMQGQHRITSGKLVAYEPSTRVPLVVRGPGFRRGARVQSVAGLQDVTPTLLDLAGVPLPAGAPAPDGVSLRDVQAGRTTSRPQLLEIAQNSRTQRRATVWKVRGVVTEGRWKYLEHASGEIELYDLGEDPDELRNLAGRGRYEERQARLAALLDRYQDCAGAACRS